MTRKGYLQRCQVSCFTLIVNALIVNYTIYSMFSFHFTGNSSVGVLRAVQ